MNDCNPQAPRMRMPDLDGSTGGFGPACGRSPRLRHRRAPRLSVTRPSVRPRSRTRSRGRRSRLRVIGCG